MNAFVHSMKKDEDVVAIAHGTPSIIFLRAKKHPNTQTRCSGESLCLDCYPLRNIPVGHWRAIEALESEEEETRESRLSEKTSVWRYIVRGEKFFRRFAFTLSPKRSCGHIFISHPASFNVHKSELRLVESQWSLRIFSRLGKRLLSLLY